MPDAIQTLTLDPIQIKILETLAVRFANAFGEVLEDKGRSPRELIRGLRYLPSATVKAKLSRLIEAGYVAIKVWRTDDYLYITEAGRSALKNAQEAQ